MPAITIISSKETFENLSSFNNVLELNEAVRNHIQHNKKALNKNAVRILQHLKQYSCKYEGVSFQSKNNIANELNLSKRTIIRNCNLLEQLGIIKQYAMKRKSDMLQTSNAIVIQPFINEYSEIVTQESPKLSLQENNIFFKKNNNIKRTSYIDHTYLPSFIDSSFIDTARPFFTPEKIYELWLRVLIAYKKSNVSRPLPEVIETVIKALKETVFIYKQGKIETSLEGYFYRLCENYLAVVKRRENKHLLYNWLEA
ncbi:helix-turn-helix domain-containing protein [Listeria monocytogenes]